MTINATAAILLALYVAAAEKQGVPRDAASPARPRTTSSRSTSRAGPTSSRRARRCAWSPTSSSSRARELPRWNTISICGYHMREAGATAAQELAFTLADAIAYVEAAVARGLDVDAFAGRLSFFFAAWSELFEEVAKFRAARRIWARLVRDRFGARDPRVDDVPLPRPDRGQLAHGPVDRQQRRPDHASRRSRRSSAAPRACTRTRATRPWRCRPRRPRAWPCGRSRSSPTRRASPRRPTRWPAATTSRR